MYAQDLKIGDHFKIQDESTEYKRVETMFQAETVYSDLGMRRQEKPLIYAIYLNKIERFHPEQVVIFL